jgi:hypothetical protein
MADSATANKRLRKQSLGSNTNTWGDTKLNEVLDVIDQCMDGYESIALTGDLTLTTTNYTTADQAKYRVINFTGTVGAVAVTFPSVSGWYLVLNDNSGAVTCKCSGGTGVAVPAGYAALIYGDGTDMANGAPQLFPGALTIAGQIHGVTAGTAATDAVNKTQMETAIATAGLPATAGTVLNSDTDTTAGYLGQKLSGSGAVTLSTTSPGGNEKTNIAVGSLALTDGGTQETEFTAESNKRYNCVFGASGTITLPAAPAAKDIIVLSLAGYYAYTLDPNGLKINSSTSNLVLIGNQTIILEYTGAIVGWV